MNRLLILLLIAVLTKSAFATLQNPDRIIIENNTFVTYSDLFKNHIRKESIFKNSYMQIDELEEIANPETEEYEVRQVYRIWEIIDNKMFLIKITDGVYDVVLNEIFKENEPKEKVFADWLTDTIYISRGEILAEGVRPVREYETMLILQNGVVISRTDYINQILKKSDFPIDTKFIYQNINWDNIPDMKDKTVQVYIGIQPKKDGKLDFIESSSFAIVDTVIITDKENPFLIEAIRIARLVKEWNVLMQRNEITPQLMTINFDQRLKKKYTR